MSSGIRSGSTIVITGAATRPRPSPTSDWTVAPSSRARATVSSAGISSPRRFRPDSALAQGAQHVGHDPTVAEVTGLARSVDAYNGVELGVVGLHLHRPRGLPVVELGDAGARERLLAGEPERLGALTLGELQRQHAHPDEVGPVEPL